MWFNLSLWKLLMFPKQIAGALRKVPALRIGVTPMDLKVKLKIKTSIDEYHSCRILTTKI
jgi:hypothetical protein